MSQHVSKHEWHITAYTDVPEAPASCSLARLLEEWNTISVNRLEFAKQPHFASSFFQRTVRAEELKKVQAPRH